MNKKEKDKRVKLFKDTCYKYHTFFNLQDLELFIEETVKKKPKFRAQMQLSHTGKMLSIVYDPGWIFDPDISLKEIVKCAFHEMTEAFLAPLGRIADLSANELVVVEATHTLIRVMENKILPLNEGWQNAYI